MAILAAAVALAATPAAQAQAPAPPLLPPTQVAPSAPGASKLPAGASIPVLSEEIPAGGGTVRELAPAFDPPHSLATGIDTWQGQSTNFGGTTIYSHGELLYTDHIFDAHGPTNTEVYNRTSDLDAASTVAPETYRLDPAVQYAPGEFGIPSAGMTLQTNYGVLDLQDQADLTQFRVAADTDALWLLARTTTMTASSRTAVLVLLGDGSTGTPRDVGFNSGIHTTRARLALLLTGSRGWVRDLASGQITALPPESVATDPADYVNAVQARIPLSLLGLGQTFQVAAATGLADATGAPALVDLGQSVNLANVAFRESEPTRDWFDKQQAFALYQGTIDPFFHTADMTRLRSGANEGYAPGPGYHDRIFQSDPAIANERGMDGVFQHYGIYLPSDYDPARTWPVQWWFHFRGGNAHIAATLVPGLVRDLGEKQHSIFISPDGRGTSRWYVGKSMADYQEVWDDVHGLFGGQIDRDREYISGHSMGGWATYLMTVLYPDRWAAGLPASAPPTQGAWTGVDLPGCDGYGFGGETPCYTSANGGDPRGELTTPLLSNERQIPLAIYQGVPDELVPTTGELMQAKRLQELGYRYRFYAFPAQEHYGPPIVDQWAQGARYEHRFIRDPNPPRVTYSRSMVFEHDVNAVQSDGVPLQFKFDRAYWMSGLAPADPIRGVATVAARSLAIPDPPHLDVPEAGGPATPGQAGPYLMFGQRWLEDPVGGTPATANGFAATLTGAGAVRFDTDRMRLQTGTAIDGSLNTDAAVALSLSGTWPSTESATLDGHPLALAASGNVVTAQIPAGSHQLVLNPSR